MKKHLSTVFLLAIPFGIIAYLIYAFFLKGKISPASAGGSGASNGLLQQLKDLLNPPRSGFTTPTSGGIGAQNTGGFSRGLAQATQSTGLLAALKGLFSNLSFSTSSGLSNTSPSGSLWTGTTGAGTNVGTPTFAPVATNDVTGQLYDILTGANVPGVASDNPLPFGYSSSTTGNEFGASSQFETSPLTAISSDFTGGLGSSSSDTQSASPSGYSAAEIQAIDSYNGGDNPLASYLSEQDFASQFSQDYSSYSNADLFDLYSGDFTGYQNQQDSTDFNP